MRLTMPGTLSFKGFGGARIGAEAAGDPHDPAVLLVREGPVPAEWWRDLADGLVHSGRRVIAVDPVFRGEPAADAFAARVEDLRAMLGQAGSRPVIVAAGPGGWVAIAALAEDGAQLAAGLVVIDLPPAEPWHGGMAEAAAVAVPVLFVAGSPGAAVPAPAPAIPGAEAVALGGAGFALAAGRGEALLAAVLDFLERRQPRAPGEFRSGSDPRTLRDAMGCFATGVTVVTALAAGGAPAGFTANSFTSVSLEPPLLLVCIASAGRSAALLRETPHFGVNVLQTGQQAASTRFAGKGEDRFATVPWTRGETGVPLLDGSLVSFECRRHAVHEAGDHFILVGEVVRAQFEPRRDPLLFFRGRYRRLHFT
jgi:flavin reductase (DIM6/NTAB) family NADH-FMN oxidoreductase RutF